MPPDELSSLLHEWDRVPVSNPALSSLVLETVQRRSLAAQFRERARASLLKLSLACLLFGVVVGAGLAEWFTLRNEDLLSSEMSSRYLHSINPKYHDSGSGVPS
jgi:hypothetical protein